MGMLDVTGASLYYETRGAGPLFLLVPGANGEAGIFQPLAEHLADQYTVVTYDRRGFSRSLLKGSQDYEHRLATDVEDICCLIKHLSKDDPPSATVFGSSSGAIVALTLFTSHPEIVHALLAHEPPAVTVLPDAEKYRAQFDEVVETYRTAGMLPAMQKFMAAVSNGGGNAEMMRLAMDPKARSPTSLANRQYWFEHEVEQYPSAKLDLDALAKHSKRLVLVCGSESRGQFPSLPNAELAKKLGSEIVEVPGGHVGYVFHAAEFAKDILAALAQRGLGVGAKLT